MCLEQLEDPKSVESESDTLTRCPVSRGRRALSGPVYVQAVTVDAIRAQLVASEIATRRGPSQSESCRVQSLANISRLRLFAPSRFLLPLSNPLIQTVRTLCRAHTRTRADPATRARDPQWDSSPVRPCSTTASRVASLTEGCAGNTGDAAKGANLFKTRCVPRPRAASERRRHPSLRTTVAHHRNLDG